MEDLSLHILDIVENSIRAGAKKIEIRIIVDREKDLLDVEIIDDGEGMDSKTLKNVLDPFYTTKNTGRVGLGLPLLAQSAEESGGSIKIKSKPGSGTRVRATFGYSHIDRRPLGDISKSLKVLIAANPDINFVYEYMEDGISHHLDTKGIKKCYQ